MPLTFVQRIALSFVRIMFNSAFFTLGMAESVEQRARDPAPGALPSDVTIRIEIAPPSQNPDQTLASTGILKTPERVPVYFFALRNDLDSVLSSNPDLEEIADTRVIFFIHGGGNVTGHPTMEPFLQYYIRLLRAVASRSRGAAKCLLIAPSYRLATVPENVFPAGLQDVVTAYDYVLGKGYKPSNIVVAGDSAGGNHAIVLTHLLLQSGKTLPHGVVAIAPASIIDHTLLSKDAKLLAKHDIIPLSVCEQMTNAYVSDSGVSPSDPLVSGAFLSFSASWPKTLILVGNWDVLVNAAREVEKRLAALNTQVELVEYDERPHAWWVLPQIFAEDIQDSVERIAQFLLN